MSRQVFLQSYLVISTKEIYLHINDLFPIILHEGVHVVDSRLIAQELGVNHSDWFQNVILKYQDKIEAKFYHLRFENGDGKTKRPQGGGKREKYVLLDENQATFIATLSKNTEQVIDFKAKLVLSFSEARHKLQEAQRLLDEIETAFATEEYVETHFERLFDMVNKLIELHNGHDACISSNFNKITEIRDKISFLESAVKSLRSKLFQHEDRITHLEKTVTELQANQKSVSQRFEDFEKYLARVRKRLGIDATCFVYIFFCPSMNMYKIGWADDTEIRQDKLRTANPLLQFVLAIPTQSRKEAKSLEQTLHIRFEYCRHNKTEWFTLSDTDLQHCHTLRLANESYLNTLV